MPASIIGIKRVLSHVYGATVKRLHGGWESGKCECGALKKQVKGE